MEVTMKSTVNFLLLSLTALSLYIALLIGITQLIVDDTIDAGTNREIASTVSQSKPNMTCKTKQESTYNPAVVNTGCSH